MYGRTTQRCCLEVMITDHQNGLTFKDSEIRDSLKKKYITNRTKYRQAQEMSMVESTKKCCKYVVVYGYSINIFFTKDILVR